MAKLEAVFLDHDGTLVDTEPYWIEAELDLPRSHGVIWTEEHSLANVGKPMHELALKMQEAGVPLAIDDIVDHLVSEVVAMIDTRGIPWLPGVPELFEDLAREGIPAAVVSNAWRAVVEKTTSTLPGDVVRFVLTGDEMVRSKPDPWPYAHAAEMLGISPEGQVAIEDSLAGTLSAEAAGMHVLVVPGVAPVPDAPGRSRTDSLANIDVETLRAIAAGEVVTPVS